MYIETIKIHNWWLVKTPCTVGKTQTVTVNEKTWWHWHSAEESIWEHLSANEWAPSSFYWRTVKLAADTLPVICCCSCTRGHIVVLTLYKGSVFIELLRSWCFCGTSVSFLRLVLYFSSLLVRHSVLSTLSVATVLKYTHSYWKVNL